MRFEDTASVSYPHITDYWRAHGNNKINAAQFGCSDSGHVFFNSTSVSKAMAYNTKKQSGYRVTKEIQEARDVPYGAIAIKVFRLHNGQHEQRERDIIFEIDPTDPYQDPYLYFDTYADSAPS